MTCVSHMAQVLNAARKAKVRYFRAASPIPSGRLRDLEIYTRRFRKRHGSGKASSTGTWGGEFRAEFTPASGEIVAQEHWCSSGFANTDLDLQLKRHGIHQLIVVGLIAHTCVEATVRFAVELGYDVSDGVRDATADYSDDAMHAALDVNIPNYAGAVVSTNEILGQISSI